MRVGSRIPNLLQAQFKRARWIRLAQTMLKGFISCTHADSDLCEMFIKQVNMLRHSRIAAFWADHGIESSDLWEEVILVRMTSGRPLWSPLVCGHGLKIPAEGRHEF